MKRTIIILIAILVCLPTAYARKTKKKAYSGTIDDSTFTDKKFNYQLTIPENWKPELQKEKEVLRLSLTQIDYEVPDEFYSFPEDALIPVINVYVDEISLEPEKYVDSLLSDVYKSEVKKKIFEKITVYDDKFEYQSLHPFQKNSFKINDLPAISWVGKVKYHVKFFIRKHLRDYWIIFICVRNNDLMLVFMIKSEKQFRVEITKEMMKFAETLQW